MFTYINKGDPDSDNRSLKIDAILINVSTCNSEIINYTKTTMAKKDSKKQTNVPIRPKRKCSVPIFNQRPKRQKTTLTENVNKNQSKSTKTIKTVAIKK